MPGIVPPPLPPVILPDVETLVQYARAINRLLDVFRGKAREAGVRHGQFMARKV